MTKLKINNMNTTSQNLYFLAPKGESVHYAYNKYRKLNTIMILTH